ncbi:hypothetical protein AeMF1_021537 [Aphanomyces euteiches]|nr:hypothetical protein AeMF1_021537 [Aphanomyces euteiches]
MRELTMRRLSDVDSRNAWLQEQAEKIQDRIVNVRQGLSSSPSMYFGTRRCTYSDVISIITTTTRMQDARPAPLPATKAPTTTLDTFLDPLFVSPLQNHVERQQDKLERHKKALVSEKTTFMGHLKLQRLERHQVEYRAASVVQRTYRGHILRKNFAKVKKTLLIRNKVRAVMKDVAKGTRLILEEKDRTRTKQRERMAAASTIQRRFRSFIAAIVVAKERYMVVEERRHACARQLQSVVRRRLAYCFVRKVRLRHVEALALALARTIQRLFRGYIDRTRVRSRRLAVRHAAIRLIQNAFTRSLARKAVAVQAERTREAACDGAATTIQRCFRGDLGRQTVARLRQIEAASIAAAAALLIQRVVRGRFGRAVSAARARWRQEAFTVMAAIEMTRIVRGFLGRRAALRASVDQETNIFVHARKGHRETVVDLLDGLGLDEIPDPNAVDGHGNTVLAVASRWGHLGVVRSVIGRIKLNIENQQGLTAIGLAVRHGHADIAEYLLTKAPEIASTGRTLLLDAARNGMVTTVEKLVLYGLAVNCQEPQFQRTPLHEAVLGGDIATIQLVVDNCPKAALNYQDGHGATALHLAAKRGDRAAVRVLLQAGVDVGLLDKKNQSAWRIAMSFGHEVIASEVRKKWGLRDDMMAAMANAADDDNDNDSATDPPISFVEEPLNKLEHLLEQGDLDIDEQDEDGLTLLMKGAMRGFYTVVRFCLRHGARLELTDKSGKTALMHAVAHSDIALHLLDQGAELLRTDDRGRTVLHDAAAHGYTFSEYVAVHKIHLDIKDNVGCTPLHEAARVGSDVGAKKLVNLGAHVSCVDLDHRSPVHFAVRSNFSPATLGVLLNAEAPALYLRDAAGRTALFDAVVAGNIPCLELLVARGGQLSDRDHDEQTLLHAAILAQQNASVEYLVEKIDPSELAAVNKALDTPLHAACRQGYGFAVEQLLRTPIGMKLISKTNGQGETPLQTATRACKVNVLAMCHQLGYDLTGADKETGSTLFHLSAEIDTEMLDPRIFDTLLEAGVGVAAFDKKGFQPLHVAAMRTKGAGAVRALLALGAPPKDPSRLTNMTPYHCAAQRGIAENVQLLKAVGLDDRP